MDLKEITIGEITDTELMELFTKLEGQRRTGQNKGTVPGQNSALLPISRGLNPGSQPCDLLCNPPQSVSLCILFVRLHFSL